MLFLRTLKVIDENIKVTLILGRILIQIYNKQFNKTIIEIHLKKKIWLHINLSNFLKFTIFW